MKVSYQLRRRSEPQAASALLLPSHEVAAVLDLCARVGSDPLPRIFATAGGFLLELTLESTAAFPGAIRLRKRADHFWLPADAELVPPLHDDEAVGLVRDRGLIFLPGRVLGYAFDRPLKLSELLDVGQVERRDWQPLPEVPYLAARIESITFDLPQSGADEIIAAGGGDIGSESPNPQAGGFLDTAASKAQAGIGKGLMGLGNLMGWQGLAKFGANLIAGAVTKVPVLSERILGKQEAALRELLRWFREGKIDDALRRALPLGGEGDRGGTPSTGWELPWHQLRYSLSGLLGGGSGPASVWFGGYDVQAELAKEYRRVAEKAIKQGDYRRAAFIYGKLLHDYRRAADVLNQGGLFRDAALIYLHKLDDRTAAAKAFEAAGDIDKAVELYRQQKLHVAAGDVLRRAGEEEAAVAEYGTAADLLIASNDHLAAGELILGKTDQVEWAESIFTNGWQRRPEVNATACGLRLARLHADQEAPAKLKALAAEARAFYDRPGNDVAAAEFHNQLARLADRPALDSARDDLRDQAKVGLAIKTRQRLLVETKPGDVVSRMLGQSGAWAAAVVSDAAYAVKAYSKRQPKPAGPRPTTRIRLGVGSVTATCWAPLTGEVFVAFDYGKIACFRPPSSELVVIRERWDYANTNSMAVDAKGEVLISLQQDREVRRQLARYAKRPNGQFHMEQAVDLGESCNLPSPLIYRQKDLQHLPVWFDEEGALHVFDIMTMTRVRRPHVPDGWVTTLWLSDVIREAAHDRALGGLHFVGNELQWRSTWQSTPRRQWWLGWCPQTPSMKGSTLPISWSLHGHHLEIAALDQQAVLHWVQVSLHENLYGEERKQPVLSNHSIVSPHGYRACAIVRPGLIAGVTDKGIDWLRTGGQYVSTISTTAVSFNEPIAAYHSPLTGEVTVICKDGLLERVTVPAG